MFLRKHIEGSRIVKVEQINGDRIMCIQTDKLEMDGSITRYIYLYWINGQIFQLYLRYKTVLF